MKIVLNAFKPFIGHHQGLLACIKSILLKSFLEEFFYTLNHKQSINLYYKNQVHNNYKRDEQILKNRIQKNVLPTNHTKKVRLIIYDNKFKTSNLIMSNKSSSSTELVDRTNVICMFKCSLTDCVSIENNMYVGLTTKTLLRCLTMHRNDSSSIALHLKPHFMSKSKFRKILVENTPIIAHEINKLWLQILEALHIKQKT